MVLSAPVSSTSVDAVIARVQVGPGPHLLWDSPAAEAEPPAELKAYYRSGRDLGTVLLSLSLLVIGHALLFRRRARPAAAV